MRSEFNQLNSQFITAEIRIPQPTYQLSTQQAYLLKNTAWSLAEN